MGILCAIPMWQNILQLFGVLILFILVLVATYYTTKWVGKSGIVQKQSQNITVVETFKIAPNKYIQIITLGSEYYAIAVTKEHIEFLTKLDQEQLDFSAKGVTAKPVTFKEIMDKITSKKKSK